MPDQKLIAVTFDRDVIRSTISKLSFAEARRQRGPIYEVLQQELYEAGCFLTAEHLDRLAQKEQTLLRGKLIRLTMSEEWDFLLPLVENCKLAEQAVQLRKCGGTLAALRICYQTLVMADRFVGEFKWLVDELYDIALKVVGALGDETDVICNEIRMRIHYKCGNFLVHSGSRYSCAVENLQRALELSRCQSQWKPDAEVEAGAFATMHAACGQALAEALLVLARQQSARDTMQAIEITRQAIFTLLEVGPERNQVLFYKVNIDMIAFLIDENLNQLALKQIAKVEGLLSTISNNNCPEIELLKAKLWLEMGRCYFNCNEFETALTHLRRGHGHTKRHDLLDLQAHMLIYLGRVHARHEHEDVLANDAYSTARKIFVRLNDRANVKKASYMMAKLKSEQIFAEFLALIKSHAYCDLFRLRQWKNRCQPFWRLNKILPSQTYPRPLPLPPTPPPSPSYSRERLFSEPRLTEEEGKSFADYLEVGAEPPMGAVETRKPRWQQSLTSGTTHCLMGEFDQDSERSNKNSSA